MLRSYLAFDFGSSFFRDRRVIDLIIEKMPVSISLGLWTTLLIYLISIPLGVAKAVRDGSAFDVWSSGGGHRRLRHPRLPLRHPPHRALRRRELPRVVPAARARLRATGRSCRWPARILDYFWHIALPVTALVVGGFAGLTMLTKNSFLEEINKQYVVTARSKGLTRRRVLYGHVFRNAMLHRGGRLPGRLRGHPVHGRPADRGDLLARRARASSASRRPSTATTRSCSARSTSTR